MRFAAATAGLAGLVLLTSSPANPVPSQANLGKKIPNFTFSDASGKPISLHDFKESKALVVIFLSFDCPVSNSYTQPLADMAREYGKHGIAFLGVTTNSDDSDADIAKHAKDYNLPFPVVCDRKLEAAEALKADITPECFVLDGDGYLRYRGRIDNAYSERLKKHPQVTEHNLRQVIGEILSGRPISVSATLAVGCPIPRNQKSAAATGSVDYYRDVLPIVQNHCQTCHRPGEVGPFSLMTYKQAVNWADDIKAYTQKRLMPPWKPVDSPSFHSQRRLSDKDVATLAAWVDGGAPAGDPKDAPPPRKFVDGWQLGTPDLVLTVPEEFTLGPTGSDVFRCYVLPTNLTEDRYVAAVEVRPGNPRVVHHTLQFIDTSGQGRKLQQREQEKKKPAPDANHPSNQYDQGPGYSVAMGVGFLPQGGLSGWAPGNLPRYLPQDAGYFIPKGADVVMQVHYHRNGRIERDRPQLGLYFAESKIKQPYQGGVLAGGRGGTGPLRIFFAIPPGEERFHLEGDLWATGDFTLHSVMPHMHMVGKEIKVTITPTEGKGQTLIHIKDWDYNWQETYFLKEPITIKKGARFHVDAYYDNSTKNPNNPFNPPRRITYGEQTNNEMCFVFLGGMGGVGGRNPRALPVTANAPAKKDAKSAGN